MRRLRKSSGTSRRRTMTIGRRRRRLIRESWLASLIKSGRRRSSRRTNSRGRLRDKCKENRSLIMGLSTDTGTESSS
jgi:hypothetical protein